MHFFAEKFGGMEFFPYLCTNYNRMRMKKILLILSLMFTLTVAMPLAVAAAEYYSPAIEQAIDEDINVSVTGQTVNVSGAQGKTLEVVSLTGRKVLTVKIESPAQKVELNIPKGCYILKIGKVVRKVSIR